MKDVQSTKDNELVSILIPTFNREKYMKESIQSALAQTYKNIEVIVVDNASTDKTWEICCQCVKREPRLKVYRNSQNLGPVRNWRKCLEYATGKYSKILWSDDIIAPNFIEKTLPFMQDYTVGFVFTGTEVFFENGKKRNVYFIGETGKYSTLKYIDNVLFGVNYPVSPGCALFRTSDLRKNLLMNIPNKVHADFSMHAIGNDLLIFLLTAHQYPNFSFVNEKLSYFRAHSDSITLQSKAGKVPLYYALASAYFLESNGYDENRIKKMNTKIWLLLKLFHGKKYGLRSVSDFYISNQNNKISLLFMVQWVVAQLRKFLLSC